MIHVIRALHSRISTVSLACLPLPAHLLQENGLHYLHLIYTPFLLDLRLLRFTMPETFCRQL